MLVLILGGRNNGKKEYLKSLGYDDTDFSDDFSKKIVYKLNDIIYEKTKQEEFNAEIFVKENIIGKALTIVCDEVGSGIVPIDKTENEYRENVGRCCCEIAKYADEVIRMYAGIPVIIKGKK